jgi:hypothetical protein
MDLQDFVGGTHFDRESAETVNRDTTAGREQQASKETALPDIVTNRFKCRQYLEGMNAEKTIRDKRDALLKLLDAQEEFSRHDILSALNQLYEPKDRVFSLFGIEWFRIRNGEALEAHRRERERIIWDGSDKSEQLHSSRERILWALIGELSLELSDVSCDKQAAEIQAEAGREMIKKQNAEREFRSWMLQHYPAWVDSAEKRNAPLLEVVKELILSQKAG